MLFRSLLILGHSILHGVVLGVAVVVVKIPKFASRMLESRYTCLTTGLCHPKWLLCALLMFFSKTSRTQMRVSRKNRKKSHKLQLFAKAFFNSSIKLSSVSVGNFSLLLKQSRSRYFADAIPFYLPHCTAIVCIFLFSIKTLNT